MTNVTVATQGTQGPRGFSILSGTGAPASSVGVVGDYYGDTTNYPTSWVLYGPKTVSGWPGTGLTVTSGSNIPNPLPIAQGGTGAQTAANARASLGLGSAATANTSAFDAAGAAASAQSAAEADAATKYQPLRAGVFDVANYGAVGDGVTDDTAAIRSCITEAVNWAVTNGRYDCTVLFRNASYLLSSAPVKGGTTHGNAQIPLPVIAPTANKVTLRLKGTGSAALPHWQQTNSQANGTMLLSTYQEVMDNTNGECSVVGGPTPQLGYGTAAQLFNNMLVIVDGVSIRTKHDHTAGFIGGFDFRGMAEAWMVQGLVTVDQGPPTITFPNGSGWEWGLAMPFPGNNALCRIDNFSCEGFTYGAWLSEHCVVDQIQTIYCYDGITIIGSYEGSGAQQHTLHVNYACVEACTNALFCTTGARLQVDQLDVENISQMHVKTADNTAVGYVGLGGIISSIAVTDPTGLRVVYIDRPPGAFSAPSIPASGSSFQSPAWRDAAVTVSGGAVSAIAVDGVTLGVTSGTVFVPSGKHITLTYTVAPSWSWILL